MLHSDGLDINEYPLPTASYAMVYLLWGGAGFHKNPAFQRSQQPLSLSVGASMAIGLAASTPTENQEFITDFTKDFSMTADGGAGQVHIAHVCDMLDNEPGWVLDREDDAGMTCWVRNMRDRRLDQGLAWPVLDDMEFQREASAYARAAGVFDSEDSMLGYDENGEVSYVGIKLRSTVPWELPGARLITYYDEWEAFMARVNKNVRAAWT